MIIASAIKLTDGRVFVGKRHGDCFNNMHSILNPDHALTGGERPTCGFINDRLQFLDRIEGYYEAYDCGQCKKQEYRPCEIKGLDISAGEWHPFLASEDLW